MKRLFFTTIPFCLFLLSGCGIEGIQQDPRLKPPLGIRATVTNNQIIVGFWYSNDEYYFDSFRLFCTTDPIIAREGTAQEISNVNGEWGKPAVYNVPAVSNAAWFEITNQKNVDGKPFFNYTVYYFYVRSYSTSLGIMSRQSDFTNIQYIEN